MPAKDGHDKKIPRRLRRGSFIYTHGITESKNRSAKIEVRHDSYLGKIFSVFNIAWFILDRIGTANSDLTNRGDAELAVPVSDAELETGCARI